MSLSKVNDLFVGRDEDRKILHTVFESKTAEFIAVYGRRRVGKTYLVKHFFKSKNAIFFHITGMRDASMREQIEDFTQVIEEVFYDNTLKITPPQNWKQAFSLLTKIMQREDHNKIILFFDELPWLASKRSRFVQALDYYWNRYWGDIPQIKLIVCGSSASWMLENVISHKGGLHNRITGQIALFPFELRETKEYLLSKKIQYDESQVLDIYMITGGIPYYLNFLKRNLSVAQNIDQLCFQNKGLLVEEFSRLYASLFTHAEDYEEIIRIIASKRNGMERKEILKKLTKLTDGGRLKEKFNALEKSGFIVSFKPYGFEKKGTFYRVIDEYSLFYLSWIEPNLSSIRKLDKTKGYWLQKFQTSKWRAWSGYAFESVCYKHIAQLRKGLEIEASALVGSWQYIPKKGSDERGAQIDLLFDREDGIITICEIKYTDQPYQLTKDEAILLNRKIEVFKKRTKCQKQVHLALITNLPIKQTMYSEEMVMNNLVLSDLFK